jgi:hypothetical protein
LAVKGDRPAKSQWPAERDKAATVEGPNARENIKTGRSHARGVRESLAAPAYLAFSANGRDQTAAIMIGGHVSVASDSSICGRSLVLVSLVANQPMR